MASGKVANQIYRGKWTPKLYDYNTYKKDFPQQDYFYLNGLYIIMINLFGYDNYSYGNDISTMIQIRNAPCSSVVSGIIYTNDFNNSEPLQIQGSSNWIYIRPNMKSSNVTQCDRLAIVAFGV